MAITINVNDLSLCHRGSGGMSQATVPDVCITPAPGGPAPVPYPNIAFSRDLAKGTRTIGADGGQSCAMFGSEFARSTGDEPGTLGGVKSGTFASEATWITHSFDVKLEGKGACRLTDKMFHNHANTVNASGLRQRFLQSVNLLKVWLCECNREEQPDTRDNCGTLGTKKHRCMERKTVEHNRTGGRPRLDGERGYYWRTGRPYPHARHRIDLINRKKELASQVARARTVVGAAEDARKVSKFAKFNPLSFLVGLAVDAFVIDPAIEWAMEGMTSLVQEQGRVMQSLSGTTFPDGGFRGPDGKLEGLFEYKFRCPPEVRQRRNGRLLPDRKQTWGSGQKAKVEALLEALKTNTPDEIDPEATATLLTNEHC